LDTGDIREAILWKFGHCGKKRIPAHHEALISELQRKRSELVSALAGSTADVFDRLTGVVGPHRYITVSFLLHLFRPTEIPIIDQHNFRAMNYYFSALRSEWPPKSKPSTYRDLATLSGFACGVRSVWKGVDRATVPSELALDRYLMMFGKALKTERRQRRRSQVHASTRRRAEISPVPGPTERNH
jgi:hypothetical protein